MSLWKIINSNTIITSPQLRIDTKNKISKETSFYTCHRATLTLEAAVVTPMLSMFLVTLLFFFQVLHIQIRVEEALLYAGRKVAVESCVVTEEALQFASAKALVLWELREDKVISRYVEGGSIGVSLLGSDFQKDKIVLLATYRVNLPIPWFGMDGITLWSRNSFQKWVGNLAGLEDGDVWVYVSPNGEVYHRLESCRALVIRVKSAFFWTMDSVRGKNGQKYYACARCVENISEDDLVYYTDYGELYHERLNCSHIKRTVDKTRLSEIEGRRPCSLCCGENEDD